MKKQIQIAIITFIIVSIICCCCSLFCTASSIFLIDKNSNKCKAIRIYKILDPKNESVCSDIKTGFACLNKKECKWLASIESTLKQDEGFQQDGWCVNLGTGDISFENRREEECTGQGSIWCPSDSEKPECITFEGTTTQQNNNCYICKDINKDKAGLLEMTPDPISGVSTTPGSFSNWKPLNDVETTNKKYERYPFKFNSTFLNWDGLNYDNTGNTNKLSGSLKQCHSP